MVEFVGCGKSRKLPARGNVIISANGRYIVLVTQTWTTPFQYLRFYRNGKRARMPIFVKSQVVSLPITIFYVDDDPVDLEIFTLAAAPLNVDLHTFSEPAKLLWAIEHSDIKPEIIFTDLNMSMLSGFDIIKILRGNQLTTPIVILTTSHNMINVQNAMNLGANYFITKPTHVASLTNAIQCTMGLDWNSLHALDGFVHKH